MSHTHGRLWNRMGSVGKYGIPVKLLLTSDSDKGYKRSSMNMSIRHIRGSSVAIWKTLEDLHGSEWSRWRVTENRFTKVLTVTVSTTMGYTIKGQDFSVVEEDDTTPPVMKLTCTSKMSNLMYQRVFPRSGRPTHITPNGSL